MPQTLRKVLQQRKHRLWSGIGLRKRCQRRLLKYLRLGKIGRRRRHIGIANAGFGSRIVRDLRLGQIRRVLQLVFARPDDALYQTQIADGSCKQLESRQSVTCIRYAGSSGDVGLRAKGSKDAAGTELSLVDAERIGALKADVRRVRGNDRRDTGTGQREVDGGDGVRVVPALAAVRLTL